MKQEFVQVPVEVVRELKRLSDLWSGEKVWSPLEKSLADTIDTLPDPPKPDVVEECAKAMAASAHQDNWGFYVLFAKACIKQYRAMGCPELE